MSSIGKLREILGESPWAEERGLDVVERDLGVALPEEVKAVCSLYGDVLISDFIFIFGPDFMVDKGVWMSDFVREGHPEIPRGVLPDDGGKLHWGHSVEGDKFFLENRGSGRWTVSAFRRNWADWYESDETLGDWLVGVFEGRIAADWMPEWPHRHRMEVD
ncbi:hypothetical protein ACGFNY_35130 [Streptomyces chartreusis]|uniref:hypothetical protein n=1 Tax=Streptomyces chartreusis TaxID=1969 RepID=UPI003723C351